MNGNDSRSRWMVLRASLYWGREMIGFKLVVLFLGAGLLFSPFFSTFGSEEAFVLLAALFG
jgi:hypothetical protein